MTALLAACTGSSGDTAATTVPGSTITSITATTSVTTTTSATSTTTVVTTADGSTTTISAVRVPEGFPSASISVVGPDGSVEVWCVLLAATPRDRARGLMEVDSLGAYEGMVFDFMTETFGAFYMLRTRIPLSVAFFATDGSFVSSTDMAPCPDDDDDPPCPRYAATGPFRWALEVPQGGLGALGVAPGSTLQLSTEPC